MVRIIDISPARDKLERKKMSKGFAHRNARGQRELRLPNTFQALEYARSVRCVAYYAPREMQNFDARM